MVEKPKDLWTLQLLFEKYTKAGPLGLSLEVVEDNWCLVYACGGWLAQTLVSHRALQAMTHEAEEQLVDSILALRLSPYVRYADLLGIERPTDDTDALYWRALKDKWPDLAAAMTPVLGVE